MAEQNLAFLQENVVLKKPYYLQGPFRQQVLMCVCVCEIEHRIRVGNFLST